MSNEEIWKPVLGSDDYFISNQGRVKNSKGLLMKQTVHHEGGKAYMRLRIEGTMVTMLVERLVEYHFPTPGSKIKTRKDINRNFPKTELDKMLEDEAHARELAEYRNEPIEEWEPIYDTQYEISNYGNCRSIKHPWRPLKPSIIGKDVRFTIMLPNGKAKTYNRAHLVAEHFIPNPHLRRYVSFRDGNVLNARVDNLYWDINPKKKEVLERELSKYEGEH